MRGLAKAWNLWSFHWPTNCAGHPMARILILYHSLYGHIERMATAEADGAREVPGTQADVMRVPELMSDQAVEAAGGRLRQPAPVATPDSLAGYDGIIFGTPTRFGNMSGQMRNFLDQTGALWMSGALVGKVGSVFVSSASQHGGQESTILTFHPTLFHLGMVVVGLPYSEARQMGIEEIKGGSPYGASTIAGAQGERLPSALELAMARSQGRHVAAVATKLHG